MTDSTFDVDTELPPGVHITDEGVFVYDRHGEIVSWDVAEFDDPQTVLTVATVLRDYYEHGPHTVRRAIGKTIGPYDALRWWAGEREFAERNENPHAISQNVSIEFAIRGFFAECPEATAVEWEQRGASDNDTSFDLSVWFKNEERVFHYYDGAYTFEDDEGENDYDDPRCLKAAEFASALFESMETLQCLGHMATVYAEPERETQVS